MNLRELRIKDAPLMLEWMHDTSVTQDLSADFSSKTIEDCEKFITQSAVSSVDCHMAIVSDADEYMGTVSLKHIDYIERNAEFAITVRNAAMSKGYSWYAMIEIINHAFSVLKLSCVYWCVSKQNRRAIRFYDKHGFHQAFDISKDILLRYKGRSELQWYSVLSGDDYQNSALQRGIVAGCPTAKINTISTINAGELSFVESMHSCPFDIKRIYYITKVPEGVRRGYHAHKTLKQLIFCPYGRIQLLLDDGKKREEVTLSDPSIGVYIDHPVWREMLWLEKDSVLCVAASDFYDVSDYIRSYEEFLIYAGVLEDQK